MYNAFATHMGAPGGHYGTYAQYLGPSPWWPPTAYVNGGPLGANAHLGHFGPHVAPSPTTEDRVRVAEDRLRTSESHPAARPEASTPAPPSHDGHKLVMESLGNMTDMVRAIQARLQIVEGVTEDILEATKALTAAVQPLIATQGGMAPAVQTSVAAAAAPTAAPPGAAAASSPTLEGKGRSPLGVLQVASGTNVSSILSRPATVASVPSAKAGDSAPAGPSPASATTTELIRLSMEELKAIGLHPELKKGIPEAAQAAVLADDLYTPFVVYVVGPYTVALYKRENGAATVTRLARIAFRAPTMRTFRNLLRPGERFASSLQEVDSGLPVYRSDFLSTTSSAGGEGAWRTWKKRHVTWRANTSTPPAAPPLPAAKPAPPPSQADVSGLAASRTVKASEDLRVGRGFGRQDLDRRPSPRKASNKGPASTQTTDKAVPATPNPPGRAPLKVGPVQAAPPIRVGPESAAATPRHAPVVSIVARGGRGPTAVAGQQVPATSASNVSGPGPTGAAPQHAPKAPASMQPAPGPIGVSSPLAPEAPAPHQADPAPLPAPPAKDVLSASVAALFAPLLPSAVVGTPTSANSDSSCGYAVLLSTAGESYKADPDFRARTDQLLAALHAADRVEGKADNALFHLLRAIIHFGTASSHPESERVKSARESSILLEALRTRLHSSTFPEDRFGDGNPAIARRLASSALTLSQLLDLSPVFKGKAYATQSVAELLSEILIGGFQGCPLGTDGIPAALSPAVAVTLSAADRLVYTCYGNFAMMLSPVMTTTITSACCGLDEETFSFLQGRPPFVAPHQTTEGFRAGIHRGFGGMALDCCTDCSGALDVPFSTAAYTETSADVSRCRLLAISLTGAKCDHFPPTLTGRSTNGELQGFSLFSVVATGQNHHVSSIVQQDHLLLVDDLNPRLSSLKYIAEGVDAVTALADQSTVLEVPRNMRPSVIVYRPTSHAVLEVPAVGMAFNEHMDRHANRGALSPPIDLSADSPASVHAVLDHTPPPTPGSESGIFHTAQGGPSTAAASGKLPGTTKDSPIPFPALSSPAAISEPIPGLATTSIQLALEESPTPSAAILTLPLPTALAELLVSWGAAAGRNDDMQTPQSLKAVQEADSAVLDAATGLRSTHPMSAPPIRTFMDELGKDARSEWLSQNGLPPNFDSLVDVYLDRQFWRLTEDQFDLVQRFSRYERSVKYQANGGRVAKPGTHPDVALILHPDLVCFPATPTQQQIAASHAASAKARMDGLHPAAPPAVLSTSLRPPPPASPPPSSPAAPAATQEAGQVPEAALPGSTLPVSPSPSSAPTEAASLLPIPAGTPALSATLPPRATGISYSKVASIPLGRATPAPCVRVTSRRATATSRSLLPETGRFPSAEEITALKLPFSVGQMVYHGKSSSVLDTVQAIWLDNEGTPHYVVKSESGNVATLSGTDVFASIDESSKIGSSRFSVRNRKPVTRFSQELPTSSAAQPPSQTQAAPALQSKDSGRNLATI